MAINTYLRNDVLHEPVEQLHARLDLRVRVRRELEEAVEDVVEVDDRDVEELVVDGALDVEDVLDVVVVVVSHPLQVLAQCVMLVEKICLTRFVMRLAKMSTSTWQFMELTMKSD